MTALVTVFMPVRRHHDYGNSFKTLHWGWLAVSEGESIIITVGHSSKLGDMVLEKELSVLHVDPYATGSELCHWV